MKEKKKRIKERTDEDIQRKVGNIAIPENYTQYTFACRFSKLLLERNMEQKEFAEGNNMTQSVVSGYINGATEPKICALKSIADFFDVSADYMLGISDIASREEAKQKIYKTIGLDEEAQKQLRTLKNNKLSRMIVNKMFTEKLIIDLVSLIQSNIEYVFIYNKLDEIKVGSVNSLANALNKQYEYVKWKTEQRINNVVESITTELINELPNSFTKNFDEKFDDKYYDKDVSNEIKMLEMLIEELSIFRKFANNESDKESEEE